MKIQVRYFAVLRERLRSDGEMLDLPDGATVGAAVAALAERHEAFGALRTRCQTAVNQTMVRADEVLCDGDELALIPPVAGGAERYVRLLDEPLSLDCVVAAVASPDAGGIVTFTGVVRRHSAGRAVERLEYEAYREMAEKVMRELCEQVEAEVAGARLAVEHRQGRSWSATSRSSSPPRRRTAQRRSPPAARSIDRLKQQVPIWKKEIGPDGAEWVEHGL